MAFINKDTITGFFRDFAVSAAVGVAAGGVHYAIHDVDHYQKKYKSISAEDTRLVRFNNAGDVAQAYTLALTIGMTGVRRRSKKEPSSTPQ